ncbi:CHASE2 domain-containing protein [Microcoleus sp. F4-D5]|uniref:CHASE2 domain-containing protein n=1 Tax=Microcoleus sp. F4-D5 TaxID=2818760 RepID=UPI002FD07FC7
MSKLVILEIGDADTQQRYPIALKVGDRIHSMNFQIRGYLPPANDLRECYENLQQTRIDRGLGFYRKLEKVKKGQITNISVKELADYVEISVNNWLNSGDSNFQPVRDRLLQVLSAEEGNVRLIVQTDNVALWSLPWHLWKHFELFKIEPIFTLFTTNIDSANYRIKYKNKIRILVILGDSTDIDVEADLRLLKESIARDDAEIVTLVATSSSKLNDQLWEQNWDILFFAGHSSSEDDYKQGKLALSETESIAIEDLKYGLQNAIEHGLKLAIFNSCDGMGLVNELASLQIPAVIAMRERVPDEVAQKFLEYFLEAFAREKKSLHDSVRKARERLHGMEGKYPCASWLPMIYEHPAVEPPTWDELLKGNEEEFQRVSIWRNLRTVLVASVLVTGAMLGVRSLGLLEPLEKTAFDRLAQIMPDKGLDSRLLIVEATADDFKQLNNEYPLQDKTIVRVLEKLNKHQPRTIGLDIYRDVPQGQGRNDLIKYLQKNERVIPICIFSSEKIPEGIVPIPNLPDSRPGFGDIVEDSDRTIRRHLLAMKPYPSSQCKTFFSLSFQLALHYLQNQPNSTAERITKLPVEFREHYWKVGKTDFKNLETNRGLYQKENLSGFQIILNYRSRRSLIDIAERVTLMQILNEQVNPSDIKDKIVLIGVTDPTRNNANYNTPYNQEIPSLMFLAQRVSQIITAVEDRIPLMWFLPQWGDTVLIFLWSVVGGFCAIRLQSRLHLGLAQGALLIILYGICGFSLVTSGCVLPLVPSGFALLGASGCLIVYNARKDS